jgi:hypothetical protein
MVVVDRFLLKVSYFLAKRLIAFFIGLPMAIKKANRLLFLISHHLELAKGLVL